MAEVKIAIDPSAAITNHELRTTKRLDKNYRTRAPLRE